MRNEREAHTEMRVQRQAPRIPRHRPTISLGGILWATLKFVASWSVIIFVLILCAESAVRNS